MVPDASGFYDIFQSVRNDMKGPKITFSPNLTVGKLSTAQKIPESRMVNLGMSIFIRCYRFFVIWSRLNNKPLTLLLLFGDSLVKLIRDPGLQLIFAGH